MDEAEDLLVAATHDGVVETDEGLALALDLVALLPVGCGESLADEIEARGLTVEEVAEGSGLGQERLGAVLGSMLPVTDDMSHAISLGLGEPFISGSFWARLDANIRQEKARPA